MLPDTPEVRKELAEYYQSASRMDRGVPRASALLQLHALHPTEFRVVEPARWEPDYLRTSGAERSLA